MEATTRRSRVAVCIITLHRPGGLWALLSGLAAQRFSGKPPAVTVVVVDNDAEGSAEAVTERARRKLGLGIEYHVEPRRGIAVARNRSIEVVRERVDACVMIDDDEVPEPGWLEALLSTQDRFEADVVAGPVPPAFSEPPPRWAVEGRFFERPRYPTGTRLETCGSGNTLVRSGLFAHLRFDESFGSGGGEDTELFLRAHRRGARIVWCDEAVAYETVPPSRVSVRWLLQRAYRDGNSYAFAEAALDPGFGTRLRRLAKGLARIAQGSFLLIGGLTGRVPGIRAAKRVCRGAGMITGVLGRRYEEYRTIHRL